MKSLVDSIWENVREEKQRCILTTERGGKIRELGWVLGSKTPLFSQLQVKGCAKLLQNTPPYLGLPHYHHQTTGGFLSVSSAQPSPVPSTKLLTSV